MAQAFAELEQTLCNQKAYELALDNALRIRLQDYSKAHDGAGQAPISHGDFVSRQRSAAQQAASEVRSVRVGLLRLAKRA